MKLLKEQFKQIEKSYSKPLKKNFQNLNNLNKYDAYNSMINNSGNFNPFPQGSYLGNSNNKVQKNFNNSSALNFQGFNVNNSSQNFYGKESNDIYYNEPFSEEFENIRILWDDLGVTENYKNIFESLRKDIDPIMKQDLFEQEIDSLGKFSELLLVILLIFLF